ncbi:hypothetical protein GCM10022630_06040 [Thermobifida alba]
MCEAVCGAGILDLGPSETDTAEAAAGPVLPLRAGWSEHFGQALEWKHPRANRQVPVGLWEPSGDAVAGEELPGGGL